MQLLEANVIVNRVFKNIKQVIFDKDHVINQTLACWLAGGHLLLEDVPGTGKTMLARAISKSIDVDNKRIQFTPDLLPSDIIGSFIYSKDSGKFVFMRGPIFTSILLADEINRATPRTQAALLQAMAEGQCTIENQTFSLDPSFFVIATQNPIEQHGTFPLPEAQLDRFMMRISIGYPSIEGEAHIVKAQILEHPIERISPVATIEEWRRVRNLVKRIKTSDPALRYALSLVDATRKHKSVALGCSPRATISLIRCAQAYSLIAGLDYVKPDFIKTVAPGVLEHRLLLSAKARLEGVCPSDIVNSIMNSIPVPVE